MQIHTYNFSDTLPDVTDTKPIKLIIKGQEQNEYDWTKVVKSICLYLYKNPKTNNQLLEIGCNYNDRYMKRSCRFNFYIDEYKTMLLTNGKEVEYLDIEVKGFNANNTLKLARDVLEECKVDLHDFSVIYTNQNQTINYQDINLKSETEKIQKEYASYINQSLTTNISATNDQYNDIANIDIETVNSSTNEDVTLEEKQETTNNEEKSPNNIETLNDTTQLYDNKEQVSSQEITEQFQDEDFTNIDQPLGQNSTGTKEGRKIDYYGFRYERNPQNRKEAIKLHGTKCFACGFDYEKTYGPFGKDFIEIHHTKPLAEQESEIIINPETDLIPLCANCHRMIHHRNPCLSLEELKELIKQNENKNK